MLKVCLHSHSEVCFKYILGVSVFLRTLLDFISILFIFFFFNVLWSMVSSGSPTLSNAPGGQS